MINQTDCLLWWNHLVGERRVIDTIYFDFNKAFDMFFPSIPVNKLVRYSLDIQILKSGSPAKIKGWYNVNTLKPNSQLVTSGVPWGSVLGLVMLFSVFVNIPMVGLNPHWVLQMTSKREERELVFLCLVGREKSTLFARMYTVTEEEVVGTSCFQRIPSR